MNVESRLSAYSVKSHEWTKPNHFVLDKDSDKLSALLDSGDVCEVIDPIVDIIEELVEYTHPDQATSDNERNQLTRDLEEEGVRYGEWVHFPWDRSVVRYPERQDHRNLRTYRNQHLVTAEEQSQLNEATVAVFGLSVGSNITDQLVQSGIGDRYVIGDFDRLSPTNLNRIRASMAQVGMRKIDVMARKISESDPYIDQVHLHDGYTESADDVLGAAETDILIEEVDNLQAKARLRRYAAEHHIPLLMVTDMGEKSLLDVERHDLEDVKPFNGKITKDLYEDLLAGDLSEKEQRSALMKITGPRHLTPRMMESAMDIDKKVSGLPQLGSTAVAGASLASVAAREILLGRRMKSGVYVQSPKRILQMQRPTTIRADLATYRKLGAFLKK